MAKIQMFGLWFGRRDVPFLTGHLKEVIMFKLHQCGSVRGDCTSPFNVIFDKPINVKEFIDYITRPDSKDWGCVSISKDPSITHVWDLFHIKRIPKLEYRYDEIISGEDIIEKYGTETIIKATADGGWTRMDYVLLIN